MKQLVFTKNWNRPEDFPPVAANAVQARANVQELHDQTRNYINTVLLAELEQKADAVMHDNSDYSQGYRLGVDHGLLYIEEVNV